MNEFDLLGPLPVGTTVLEASAGTGKTFTIAGLVTRYVAEGYARLDELLVVTFGRAATQELRDRVRERLVRARDGLTDPAAARATTDDPLLVRLATGSDPEVAARRTRLVQALGSFDSATVATTHQFCQQVLVGLGTAGDVDATAVLVENLDDLTVEVVQDLYLRMWSREAAGVAPMSYAEAVELAHTVVRDGQALLVPEVPEPNGVPDIRRRFALKVRDDVETRKRERYLLSFDDLLTRLQATLADERSGAPAADRLRSRYRVVLVDEFQDTDPVQWDILRLAFHGHTTLVLIGDPKQAIYAFRGADVHAYLAAAELADHHATLARNWRSDPELLQGLDAMFRGAALGDPRIVVQPVRAGHPGRSLTGDAAPVQVRVVPAAPSIAVAEARELVTADVVAEIVDLLSSGRRLTPRGNGPARAVRPADIAVVVRTGAQLDQVHAALLAAGVPSVQRTTSSVFRTAAGADWVVLLEALEQPHRGGRVRRLAITSFVGWDAAALEENDLDELGLRLRGWLRVLDERGIAALLEAVSRDERLPSRLLGQVDGERRLTDLRHVGEALHAAAMAGQLGLTASLEWLRRRVDESDRDSSVERSRRLDSDAAAVQVVTVHASKGLEFPVVLVPFGWDRWVRDVDIPLFHDAGGRRVRNVGGPGPGFLDDQHRHDSEEFGEDLRLLYVAMTRAQAQVTAWWAPSSKNTKNAPLHRLMFAAEPGVEVPEMLVVPRENDALTRLSARAVDGCLSVTAVGARPLVRWRGPAASTDRLTVAQLLRPVDSTWRRTSYSALTQGAHDVSPGFGSEPEVAEKDDEPETPTAETSGDAALREIASPMADLPGGTSFGTLVHAVLENLDPTTADLEAAVRAQAHAQSVRFGSPGPASADVADALLPSLRTPLGPLAGDRALTDIARRDRLVELDFELPLRGGDRPNGETSLRELAGLLRAHLPAGDPLAGYADLLEDPLVGEAALRGYLGGSIDAVLRLDGRYVVVDYKTNRLGAIGVPLTAWDYRADAMAEAMLHAHYPLQALLYSVALHRFLRWRQPGYDPEAHLGGVLYLFLRGMCGPGVVAADGTIPGVFAWRPPAALVVALSDALAVGVGA
ncbi:MAG TPA: UvrD-helicase domain-containing protein [Jatrophihabitans sp.]|uniref:UvrD-helicase domain-containing protein n=1 Tax=Jatrophihabitans sp. TaxID=1932789 RepID=UPI002E0315D8|nr:UvrD-helicase domain-containing protein [Jatrophihabitans sp.]